MWFSYSDGLSAWKLSLSPMCVIGDIKTNSNCFYHAPKKVPLNAQAQPNLWTELTCLQCVYICCVFVGDISFEIKTETDSNDITQYQHDDIPSTGMIVFH